MRVIHDWPRHFACRDWQCNAASCPTNLLWLLRLSATTMIHQQIHHWPRRDSFVLRSHEASSDPWLTHLPSRLPSFIRFNFSPLFSVALSWQLRQPFLLHLLNLQTAYHQRIPRKTVHTSTWRTPQHLNCTFINSGKSDAHYKTGGGELTLGWVGSVVGFSSLTWPLL